MSTASKPAARLVKRTLRFAWIELEDPRDGIAFDRAFSSAELGWRNLFLDLPPKAGSRAIRVSPNWPSLRIEWTPSSDNPKEQGLIAFPSSREDGERIAEWVLSPGISKGQLEPDGTDAQADLVVVSGHGADGLVMGHDVVCNLSEAFRSKARATSPSTRVRYLLLPACYLATEMHAVHWAPLFTRRPAFHGCSDMPASTRGTQSVQLSCAASRQR